MKIRWPVVLIDAALLCVAACSVPEEAPGVRGVYTPLAPEGLGGDGIELIGLRDVGRLTGRLIGPSGASFADMWVLASTQASDGQNETWVPRAFTDIAEDGSFDLYPLDAGEVNLELVLPDNGWEAFADAIVPGDPESLELVSWLEGLPIGAVGIRAGYSLFHDVDLRDRFPGVLQVRVSMNGAPATGMSVTARPGAEGVAWRHGRVTTGGAVALEPLLPGTWTLSVGYPSGTYYEGGEWVYIVPTSVVVSAGRKIELAIDIPLHDGTLTVLDAESGEPVTGGVVFLNDVDGGNVRRVTDHEGRINATLPPGTYEARRWERGGRRVEPVEIEWTAAGPVPSTLRLATPELPDGDD